MIKFKNSVKYLLRPDLYHRLTTFVVVFVGTVVLTGYATLHSVQAQTSAATNASGATLPSTTDYQISPSDVVSVDIVNFPDLSKAAATVTPDGDISLPLLNSVHLAGLTPEAAGALLEKRYAFYLVKPSISVSVAQMHSLDVLVTGYVQRPGGAAYQPPMDVLAALADVGGPLPDGTLSHVTLTRKAGGTQTLNLSHPESKAGTADDPAVSPGDIIYVPENRDEVTVVGEVTRPGTMDYKENMTVADALTNAGPVLSDADLTAGVLTHNGVDTPIDLDALLNRPDSTAPVQLSPGDRLLVPLVKRTFVFGDVERAGSFNYKPGDRVSDAMSAAIPGPSAMLSDVNLVRIAKDKNSAVVTHINYQQYFEKGVMADNVLLQPGDTLYVRPVKQKFNLAQLGQALQGVNLLNTGAYVANHGLGH